MRLFAITLAACGLWTGLTQDAASEPARSSRPQSECFNTSLVSNFNAPNDEVVYLRVGVRDVYRLKLFAPCLNASWAHAMAIRSVSGSSWICSALDAEVIVQDRPMGPQRCQVSELKRLTPEEVAALPKKDRP